MVQVKFFQTQVRSQGNTVKIFGTNRKVLPQGIHMPIMYAYLFDSKVTARVKYFQKLVKSQGQGREVKDLLI